MSFHTCFQKDFDDSRLSKVMVHLPVFRSWKNYVRGRAICSPVFLQGKRDLELLQLSKALVSRSPKCHSTCVFTRKTWSEAVGIVISQALKKLWWRLRNVLIPHVFSHWFWRFRLSKTIALGPINALKNHCFGTPGCHSTRVFTRILTIQAFKKCWKSHFIREST